MKNEKTQKVAAKPLWEIALGQVDQLPPEEWIVVYGEQLCVRLKLAEQSEREATRQDLNGKRLAVSVLEAVTEFTRSTGWSFILPGKIPGMTKKRWLAGVKLAGAVSEAANLYADGGGSRAAAALGRIARDVIPAAMREKIQAIVAPQGTDKRSRDAAEVVRKLKESPLFRPLPPSLSHPTDDDGEAN